MATPMAGGQTPATLRLAGIEPARAPSLERRSVEQKNTAERSPSRPARRPSSSDAAGGAAPADAPGPGPSAEFYERAGDLAKAERLYAPQEAVEMYLRHKMVGEAVRVTRESAGVS